MTVLRTPVNGICLPECWYSTECPRLGQPYLFTPFPWNLRVYADNGGYIVWSTAISLAGRPFVEIAGGYCPAVVDPYIDGSGYVNVWKAFQDGIWTSSTTIRVRVASSDYGTTQVNVFPAGPVYSGICGYLFKSACPRDITPACPTTLSATVTVYDDGTVSVA